MSLQLLQLLGSLALSRASGCSEVQVLQLAACGQGLATDRTRVLQSKRRFLTCHLTSDALSSQRCRAEQNTYSDTSSCERTQLQGGCERAGVSTRCQDCAAVSNSTMTKLSMYIESLAQHVYSCT